MADESVLELFGMGVHPFSIRGATQTLEPINAAFSVGRTVNGTLIDLSGSQFKKYASAIRCNDQQPPAFDGLMPGDTLTVWSIAELAVEGSTATDGLSRPIVPGSLREEEGFTIYRPILVMMVMGLSLDHDEYDRQVGWQLDLEEI